MKFTGFVNLPLIGIEGLYKELEYYNKFVTSIEIIFDYPLGPSNITYQQVKNIKDTISAFDFKVLVHGPFVYTNLFCPSDIIFKCFLNEIKNSLKFSQQLNSELITLHMGTYSVYQNKIINELTTKAIKNLELLSKDYSIPICIENMDIKNSFRRGFPLVIDDFRVINDSELFITLDTGHALLMNNDPSLIFSKFKNKIKNIHCHDSNKNNAHLKLGLGFFKYKKFINNLLKNKYNGYIGIEILEKDDFELSLNVLKKLINKL